MNGQCDAHTHTHTQPAARTPIELRKLVIGLQMSNWLRGQLRDSGARAGSREKQIVAIALS